jgi:choline-sulfatase
LWDDGTRVPLIFAGPGIAKAGRCTKPAELLDMYPTLLELCGLPENKQLEGHSLVPQLKDANAEREWPAITTHNKGNHGIRSEGWRYITYADGTEELYDMRKDPNEWTNLVKNPKYADVISQHRKWIPKVDRKPAPGSSHRVLTFENGQVNWEGEDVASDDPIPEL